MTIDQKIEAMRSKVRKDWRPRYELVETIQATAIALFDCSKDAFFNGERTRDVSYARLASMAVCRKRTQLSLNSIAEFHRVTHGSVTHACACEKLDVVAGIAEIERILDIHKDIHVVTSMILSVKNA